MNLPNSNIPRVGVGVLIIKDRKILLGARNSSHGFNTWGPPGGYLEFGETFEQCAIREVNEEIGLSIDKPAFVYATNNIFSDENKHTVSIFMKAEYPANQVIINRESDKALCWDWFSPDKMPANLFLPLNSLSQTGSWSFLFLEV